MIEQKDFSIFGDEDEQLLSAGTDEGKSADEGEDSSELIITEEVIAVVAAKAALALPDVHSMSTGVAADIVEALGVVNPTKGVVVKMNGECPVIDLYVVVMFGRKFSDIAWDIQETVKSSVENYTGATVAEVNVHINGVEFEEEQK